MKIVFITGNHPRHAFLARALAKTGYLETIIVEEREHFVPLPSENINDDLKKLFIHHFDERERVELQMFNTVEWPNVNINMISKDELNSEKIRKILKDNSPDLLMTYGCHMLTDETLQSVQGEKWNCHGGLSPWYRGAITHFWPSYMLEPQMTGMTIHELTQQLDAGDIVHQCAARLIRGDTLHQLAARAVMQLGEELPFLISKLIEKKGKLIKKPHSTSGMLWLGSKWRPEHLKIVYEQFNDKIVDAYLDGNLENKSPNLYRQF